MNEHETARTVVAIIRAVNNNDDKALNALLPDNLTDALELIRWLANYVLAEFEMPSATFFNENPELTIDQYLDQQTRDWITEEAEHPDENETP